MKNIFLMLGAFFSIVLFSSASVKQDNLLGKWKVIDIDGLEDDTAWMFIAALANEGGVNFVFDKKTCHLINNENDTLEVWQYHLQNEILTFKHNENKEMVTLKMEDAKKIDLIFNNNTTYHLVKQ